MTPDERSLLERTAALTEENNQLLKKMQKSARWQRGFQIVYWVLIILFSFGAIYLIQPYINSLTGALGGGSGSDGTGSTSYAQELQQALGQ